LHRENFDNPVSFGSESYSKEEVIAEMTAAMLCGIVGIEQKTLENSAAYLKTGIPRLKSDSRLLASAASQAQKAADFIQGKLARREREWQPVGVDDIKLDPTLTNTLTWSSYPYSSRCANARQALCHGKLPRPNFSNRPTVSESIRDQHRGTHALYPLGEILRVERE
jgi:hypothetical protein